MVWKTKKYNNLKDKHVEVWFSILNMKDGDLCYYIMPQYQSEDGFMMDTTKPPELYLVFSGEAHKSTDEEKKNPLYAERNWDGYTICAAQFRRAFTDKKSAEKYADALHERVLGMLSMGGTR